MITLYSQIFFELRANQSLKSRQRRMVTLALTDGRGRRRFCTHDSNNYYWTGLSSRGLATVAAALRRRRRILNDQLDSSQ